MILNRHLLLVFGIKVVVTIGDELLDVIIRVVEEVVIVALDGVTVETEVVSGDVLHTTLFSQLHIFSDSSNNKPSTLVVTGSVKIDVTIGLVVIGVAVVNLDVRGVGVTEPSEVIETSEQP
jgi:hypothetical protein